MGFAGLAAVSQPAYRPRLPRPRVVKTRDDEELGKRRRYRKTWRIKKGRPEEEIVDVLTGGRFTPAGAGDGLGERLAEDRALAEQRWELGAPGREREERLIGEARGARKEAAALVAGTRQATAQAKITGKAKREAEVAELGEAMRIRPHMDPTERAEIESRMLAIGGELPEAEKPWKPITREEQLGFAEAKRGPQPWEPITREEQLGFAGELREARRGPEEPAAPKPTIVEKEREKDVADWQAGGKLRAKPAKLTEQQSTRVKGLSAEQLRSAIADAIRGGRHDVAAALEREYNEKISTGWF